jgi:hypothetical protein
MYMKINFQFLLGFAGSLNRRWEGLIGLAGFGLRMSDLRMSDG